MNVFLLVIILLAICIIIPLIFYCYEANKWHKRGFNDTLYEIDMYLSGKRPNKLHVEKPYGPYLCNQNEWWWKGAYDAYNANLINLNKKQ